MGTIPFLCRVANSIRNRKIAVVGDERSCESLSVSLKDSGLFKRNVVPVTLDNIDKLEVFNTILLDWNSYSDMIENVFTIRKSDTSITIFAKPNSIPNDQMTK